MRIVKPAEERKNEILDVAERLFAEKGFDNASTNDIIKEIGIARGTLYHHFQSKEEILDAIVDRMTGRGIERAARIVDDRKKSILERLIGAIGALNLIAEGKGEVLDEIHKPQNALLHQKMQERLLSGVVPLIAKLVEEGNESGLFHTPYPNEAVEMIMTYSGTAFDELAGLSPEEKETKGRAFIFNTERLVGAKEGSLKEALTGFFSK